MEISTILEETKKAAPVVVAQEQPNMHLDSCQAVLGVLMESFDKCCEVGDNALTVTVHITEPVYFRAYCTAALEYAINYLRE